MILLLTNDDGIEAKGLNVLRRLAERKHEVWVVAPDRERSGTSHAVTLKGEVGLRRLEERIYSSTGTPADCVLYALLGALPIQPDIVLSGINHGPNIGTDIIYSGTAAAARQAALMGIPGVAISLADYGPELDFQAAASFTIDNLENFSKNWDPGHFVNINVPPVCRECAEAAVTRPAIRIYGDEVVGVRRTDEECFFSLRGLENHAHEDRGTDWEAVEDGLISVSPVNLHPLNQIGKEAYHSIEFQIPGIDCRAG